MHYPNGQVRHLSGSATDLNPAAAADMARVKAWSLHFLRRSGFAVPEFDFFFADAWASRHRSTKNEAAAVAFAERLGYPLVLKPSCQTYGNGVHLVASREELEAALPHVLALDPMFLLQRLARGVEYRLVVFDGRLELAYVKTPLEVVGDGRRTVEELLAAHLAWRAERGEETAVRADSAEVETYLARQGWTLRDVLPLDVRAQVRLGAAGPTQVPEAALPPFLEPMALAIARCAGLRLCGIDLIVDPTQPGSYALLEVNAAPEFDDFACIGAEQDRQVEALMERMILAMGEGRP
ncbi:hypothetical protein J7643_11935 [bacterium]|nr:hypothetical protein [bacterium]